MSSFLEYACGVICEAWPLFLCAGVISIPLLTWISSWNDDEYDSIYDHYDIEDIREDKNDD